MGDIVPLLFGWLSQLPYSFVGTAKSDYYLRDEHGSYKTHQQRPPGQQPTDYYPWERWLMQRPSCQGIFPRDTLTTLELQARQVRAVDAGNPMMDGFTLPTLDQVLAMAPSSLGSDSLGSGSLGSADLESGDPGLSVLLLPGSRVPEAYGNWQRILTTLPSVIERYPTVEFLAAAAPALADAVLDEALITQGWRAMADGGYQQGTARLKIAPAFMDFAQRAGAAIAMAGTATEQFVGLGKPALILPGTGPQFTPAFAQAQTLLLGPSVTLVEHPTQTGTVLAAILQDPQRRQQIYENGRRRMGEPGAAARIAAQILAWLGR
ncbi:MAG: lipid-A-disaccharide synthase-related protein [Cyanobacteria bacterium P01_A01_bin.105]